MDWEAQDEGVIAKILAPDGSKDIPVGTVVAVVVEDAEHVSALSLQAVPISLLYFERWGRCRQVFAFTSSAHRLFARRK